MFLLTSSDRTALNCCAWVLATALVLEACKIYSWLGDRQLNAWKQRKKVSRRERRWEVNKCALVFSWLSASWQEWKVWPQRVEGEQRRAEQTETMDSDRGRAPRKKKKQYDNVLAWQCTMTTKSELVSHNILYTAFGNDNNLVWLKDLAVSQPIFLI